MQTGVMVYWRFKGVGVWLFGYVTKANGANLYRMGSYNGDTHGGHVVDASEIETRPYTN